MNLEDEVHSIWDLCISDLQKCKGNGFLEVGLAGNNFRSGIENVDFLPLPESTSPENSPPQSVALIRRLKIKKNRQN